LAWAEARPSLAVLLVLEDRRIVRSRRLERFTAIYHSKGK
jgi:hypothetical protein